MVRMRAPYTGLVHEVDESRVELRLSQGFSLCDEVERRPDASFTVAEIRAYAKRHGIELPADARKSELLELV